MDVEFEQALARLSEVAAALDRLPADDFAARYPLLTERDALRDRLAELRGTTDPDADRRSEDLRAELKALEQSAAALRKQQIDPVSQAGGGSPGAGEMGNLGAVRLNAMMSESTGLAAMVLRIERLRSILADRADG